MNDFSEKPVSSPHNEPPPRGIVNDFSNRPQSVLAQALWASLLTVAHAAAWSVVFYALLFAVPRFKKIFADFAMKLPWLTELVIDVSDALTDQVFIPPVLFAFIAGLDAVVLFLLRRRQATAPFAWLWFVLFLLIPFCISALFCIALLEPLLQLMDSLSK